MMWGDGFNWLNMTLMMLGSTLLLVFLVVLVWVGIRWRNQRLTSPTQQVATLSEGGPTPREILSKRYAQGEIDATTFEQMGERLEAADTRHQRSRGEVHRPIGESLFDGRASGPEI